MARKPTYEELEEKVRALESCEAQLKDAQDKLLVAEKYGKIGWWEFEIQTQKLDWSDEVYEIHGITHDEDPLQPDRIQEIIDPAFHDYQQRQINRLLEDGVVDFEYPVNRPDGK